MDKNYVIRAKCKSIKNVTVKHKVQRRFVGVAIKTLVFLAISFSVCFAILVEVLKVI